MSKRAEDFMDSWLDASYGPAPQGTREIGADPRKKCATDAKKASVPLEELEEVVVDIEQAITNEMAVAAPKGNPA